MVGIKRLTWPSTWVTSPDRKKRNSPTDDLSSDTVVNTGGRRWAPSRGSSLRVQEMEKAKAIETLADIMRA